MTMTLSNSDAVANDDLRPGDDKRGSGCASADSATRIGRAVRKGPITCAALAILCGAIALLSPVGTVRADEALLIGGGYAVDRSEAQIELNVGWVQQVLERAGLPVTTFFTDGNEAGADVFARSEDRKAGSLSRLFGDRHQATLDYRENGLPNVTGSTRRQDLVPALQQRIDANEDALLLVYNGHGSQSPDSPAGVSLELWDQTTLRADELHTLLQNRTAPVRWVFTQCYSGGFHRLAFADPHDGLALAEGQRCGFTSESAYRLAEGCSASIDIGDYRDYTTYFFAALDGHERNGAIVDRNPDRDADGQTSPREAHLYALEHAYSSDLSRSTSEAFLDAWQPWYLRWLPQPKQLAANEYARLYRDLAARLQITLDRQTVKGLRKDLADLQSDTGQLWLERERLRDAEDAMRATIARDVLPRFPALLGPYGEGYRALVKSGEITRAAELVATHPDYPGLIATQDADDALDARLVETERAAVQRLKLLRFRRLATLVEQLQTRGSEVDRARYAQLLDCESTPFDTAR